MSENHFENFTKMDIFKKSISKYSVNKQFNDKFSVDKKFYKQEDLFSNLKSDRKEKFSMNKENLTFNEIEKMNDFFKSSKKTSKKKDISNFTFGFEFKNDNFEKIENLAEKNEKFSNKKKFYCKFLNLNLNFQQFFIKKKKNFR